jgi:predicted ArsR family transcriptional regulator
MDFAKSSELILNVLNSHGKLSQKEIANRIKIPGRTIRYNLKQLIDRGLVRESLVWQDLRQKQFERGDELCLNLLR